MEKGNLGAKHSRWQKAGAGSTGWIIIRIGMRLGADLHKRSTARTSAGAACTPAKAQSVFPSAKDITSQENHFFADLWRRRGHLPSEEKCGRNVPSPEPIEAGCPAVCPQNSRSYHPVQCYRPSACSAAAAAAKILAQPRRHVFFWPCPCCPGPAILGIIQRDQTRRNIRINQHAESHIRRSQDLVSRWEAREKCLLPCSKC